MSWLEPAAGAVRLRVWLQPRSRKNEIVGIHDDCLKIKVASPPIENRANKELRSFLADLLDVAPVSIEIRSGLSGRRKTVEISGLDIEYIRTKLSES